MELPSPVEKTTRYARCVATLADAWAFVMEHLDSVGSEPQIMISPMMVISEDGDSRGFEVVVSGMVQLETEK